MLDGRFKANIEKGLRPIGLNLRKTGITADHLTTLGVVMAAARGGGHRHRASSASACSCSCSPACPTPSTARWPRPRAPPGPRGAFFDSVSDRVSDSLLLGGVAWYLASTHPGHLSLLPMAVLAASLLISYQRAKADALGFDARGGIMERAERVILLGLGLLFDSLLVADPVGHAGPHAGHRGAAVREGLAPGQRRAPAGQHRSPGPSPGRPGLDAVVAAHPAQPPRPLTRLPPPLGFNRVSATYKTGSALFRGLPRPVAEVVGPLRQPGRGPRLGRAAAADRAQPAAGARARLHRRAAARGGVPRRSSPTPATGSTRSGCRA